MIYHSEEINDMSNKRYYWLKLKENFFEDDTIQWLEEQENGKEYALFYLKLCLKSLKTDGKLVRFVGEKLIPYDKTALAKMTNTDADTVVVAMNLFKEIGLISIYETGEIFLNQLAEMVGSETNKAESMRRLRIENSGGNIVTRSYPDVTKSYQNVTQSKSKSKSIDNESQKEEKLPYKDIIDYLNERADRQFKIVDKTKTLIKTRWNEGQRLIDFKKVIDIKVKHANDTSDFFDSKYLQPSTLFGNKFDEYLNQCVADIPKKKKEGKTWQESMIEEGLI